ncbi:MAG: methyltransferase domain-containing protein [Anaerolineae bacterium]|nr:methyltransferase domain-containing protein [Anaerolineae bacterium]
MPLQHIDAALQHVESRYDSDPGYEWERLNRHRTELAVTLRAFDEHLPPPPVRVLDCGGGPGRYAIELTRRGYRVTLFDLSRGNLALARDRVAEAGVTLDAYEHGTATDLSRFIDGSFDVVLLMGPLYHLLEEADRKQALAEVVRVLRPGGQLWTAYVTRYAPLRYAAAKEAGVLDPSPQAERVLATGVLPPRGEDSFVAYFAHPTEVTPTLRGAGLDVVEIWGVEALVSQHEEGVNTLEGEDWARWVDLNYRVSTDPCLHGGVEHLLALAVKPRWRAVLREIVTRLDAHGVAYKVVGGTSVALHGAPVRVSDIDLEMPPQDTYRFQALFEDSVIKPVELCHDDTYRSHFGRFNFDGVMVEIMGDLHRREGETWVPSMNQTETEVEFEGVRVRVPWLEEEMLACIRRGRLERVTRCMPFCDPGRLRALIRGEPPTGVI